MKNISKMSVLILFLLGNSNFSFTQNAETGVDGLAIGSKQDNTYSAFVIHGPGFPLEGGSKRDILFKFNNAGQSAIRAYRGREWDTALQFLTTRVGGGVDNPQVSMHIDGLGRVGIGTTDPWTELDVNGTIRSKALQTDGIQSYGDLQLGGDTPVSSWGDRLWFSHRDNNTDPIFMSRYNTSPDASELRVSIGDFPEGRDRFCIGHGHATQADVDFTPVFVVQSDTKVGIGTNNPTNELDVNGTISSYNLLTSGSIGIGTINTEGYKLAVNGIIRAKEIKVESDWADFVFKKDYKLPTLKEVETHINENGTLPGIPSEAEVKANGVNLAETNALLLQKIEELTLYIIQQEKRMESMEAEIKNIRSN